MKGWEVQYSGPDDEEVCVIPKPGISFDDLDMLMAHFREQGYNWWLCSDERLGYRFTKNPKGEK